ncbi:glutamate-ammonia-ligase adenylyltransferase [Marinicauda pacifica]|uniref:Bifunctional [glutamine synthetase] adenylyltransferase/[glutamine synthetase]-adenylyl-L-tyrosine phosphorylase n=1 Tax=Marinicauda pacifica TaxID=1133559 RepID=A0A4S2H7C9_9PROT|nr:bifunctional [glutamine synthetase] adenylyltransferase/[glutamine synthetase]-adenylyl-L-tyrosine phosphorylase [Marinicauda pacifica]TGY91725.1 bifunctional [glutamine synthetase] adenylyltransferase/[glutamine synthetase]-adenylyl-L-tyrosine phosphorylase [Marinicauda pacifica]GGE50939.1 glutamate-ammonia-ligase adenylyltransferase [Marinicauda pacifica]
MPDPIPARLTRSLPVCDTERAARVRARLPDAAREAWAEASGFVDAVFAAAPYLGRLAVRRAETFLRLARDSPEAVIADAIERARAVAELSDHDEAARVLREAKSDLHLAAALADLSGAYDLSHAVGALTAFADASVQGALGAAVRIRGFDVEADDTPLPGYFVLALGKMGTGTLNYSSDIDLVVLFEPDRIVTPEGKEPQKALDRLTQTWVRLMSEETSDGYVFRVDHRLRPDPSSTPVSLSAESARRYFEAVGQNWERAAYAKARVCAGDREAGEAFLRDLEPFIWRRALDFAAVEDIRSLAKQIQSIGRRAEIRVAGHDVKLGRGGIREVEFYAQVMQLLFGGRKPALRVPDTVGALRALQAEDLIAAEEAEALIEDYRTLRHVEHRIQMREDEQTQTLPADRSARAAVAALFGEAELEAFDAQVTSALQRIHAAFSEQFDDGDSLATGEGSLVLTGVEPTPDTLATLSAHGFSQPEQIWSRLSGWAAGRARAGRTERARGLFSRLAPRLVEAIGATGDADRTFARFAKFFEGLPSGVQPLSLLVNHPELADELIAILGLAPRLAEVLARRPALLDIMLDPSFAQPLKTGDRTKLAERMREVRGRGTPFELALNQARRIAREERLRIGAQTLLGRASAGEAGRAYTDLAEAAIEVMSDAALNEVARRHGPPPGRFAILGLGKLGGCELSADSDLDIMVVYQADREMSEGERPIGCDTWFSRFTQRLVAALSAPTEEGDLFDVDLALRPSGSAGPVAVSLARFESYYQGGEAWTWERMALTRARIVGGQGLDSEVSAALDAAMACDVAARDIRRDAAAMRARLERDKPAGSLWNLKLRTGGLIEIEFIAQTGQLVLGRRLSPSTAQALRMLVECGALPEADGEALTTALRDYSLVTQLLRLAHGSGFDPDTASLPFAERLGEAVGVSGLQALQDRLDDHAARVRALFVAHIGEPQLDSDG